MVHQAMGAEAVILPRSHRTSLGLRDHHGPPYQDRHLVGRVLSRLPSFTRMANRDDGLARNCLSLLTLVCAEI
ncbi:MAG: hypothetical protein SGJ26_16340 [Nitrospirota bacterium]|nr:hypothetical protein [Nitrospirota bacterium]